MEIKKVFVAGAGLMGSGIASYLQSRFCQSAGSSPAVTKG